MKSPVKRKILDLENASARPLGEQDRGKKSGPMSTSAFRAPGDIEIVDQHIIEFVSDSGEGAQTAGQLFGTVSAKMGNGVWTVEIIPADIEPPQRSRAGASGNRIRIGSAPVTNMGDAADTVVAFNEQVLYSRIGAGALVPGTTVLLESKWAEDPEAAVREAYADALEDFADHGYRVIEVPMEQECLKCVPDPRRGKNIWAVGMLSAQPAKPVIFIPGNHLRLRSICCPFFCFS